MITMLNRKEVETTFDMKRQAEVRDLLASHNIDYQVKTVNRKSPSIFDEGSRGRTGTFGEKLDVEYQYIIYVNKADYEQAMEVIRG